MLLEVHFIHSPQINLWVSCQNAEFFYARLPFWRLYQVMRAEILIVSVMDLRRDPAPWRKHL